MKVSKEYKLGLLTLLGCILLFVGINLLKAEFNPGRSGEYYAIFDNASGLDAGNQVQLNGIKIGEVLEIGLLPDNPRLVLTRFSIENSEIKIPKSSEAWLISTDILGTKCIDLRLDTSDSASSELLADGDTLNSKEETTLGEEINEELEPLKVKTRKLIGIVESIIVDVNTLWDSSTAYVVEESMYEAREAINTYRELARNLTDLINRETQLITGISQNIDIVRDSVTQKLTSIHNIANNILAIQGDVNSPGLVSELALLNGSMQEMNAWLSDSESTEGTLLKFTRTQEFQNALSVTKKSMDSLMKDIAADPRKYIGFSLFGKKIQGLKLTREEEKILKDWLAP